MSFANTLTDQELLSARNVAFTSLTQRTRELETENESLKGQIKQLESTNKSLLGSFHQLASRGSTPSAPPSAISTSSSPMTLASLVRTDYPLVKHWFRIPKNKAQVKAIRVSDTDMDTLDDMDEDEDVQPRKKEKIHAFLETAKGKLVHYTRKGRIFAGACGWWLDSIDVKRAPASWSKTGESKRKVFRLFMETEFPELQLCAEHWKADKVWKLNYHSWLNGQKKNSKDEDDNEDEDDEEDDDDEEEEDDDKDVKGNSKSLKRKRKVENNSENIQPTKKVKPSASTSRIQTPEPMEKGKEKGKGKPVKMGGPKDVRLLPKPKPKALSSPIDLNALDEELGITPSPPPQRQHTFTILKPFREKIESLPAKVPIAKSNHPLAKYRQLKVTQGVDEYWEDLDRELNTLTQKKTEELTNLVARGEHGLFALLEHLEHVVRDLGLDEGMLEGKVNRLVAAIDSVTSSKAVSAPKPPAPKALTSNSQPATKASAKKASVGEGRGKSWQPPPQITPQFECAREWKMMNPKGTKKKFEEYYSSLNKAELKKWTRISRELNTAKAKGSEAAS